LEKNGYGSNGLGGVNEQADFAGSPEQANAMNTTSALLPELKGIAPL
jgi:hypothetical protein